MINCAVFYCVNISDSDSVYSEGVLVLSYLKNKILFIFAFAFLLTACSVSIDDDASLEHLMSREYVDSWCSASDFGWTSDSPEYMALNYIYSLDELKERYGENFTADDVSGNAEWGKRFLNYYSGKAEYVVTVKKEKWIVQLNKNYLEKWEIVKCCREGE